jgi:RNA polymerase sigma factor (sigma-70 family)
MATEITGILTDRSRGDAARWIAAYTDPDAFGDVCERHIEAIHAFARRRVGDGPAADLTAETLAQAWSCRRRLKPARDEDVAAWLHGIAGNLIKRYVRSQVVETRARRRLGMQLRFAEDDASDALHNSLTARSLQPELEEALRGLPEQQRRAVIMRVVEELGYPEIGLALGCSEPVARMKVARALRAMRGHLRQSGAHS